MSPEASTASADPTRLVFGFAPSAEGDRTRQALVDLCRAIGDAIQMDVAPMRVSSQDALERAILEERAHFGWFSPVTLARLELENKVVPIAQARRDTLSSFHACLVVREDSPVASISDLRVSNVVRIAWVDPGSAAGYVIPRLLLLAEGVLLQDGGDSSVASSEVFAQSHAEVVRLVADGLVDVGATFKSMKGEQLLRAGWTDPDGSNPRPIRTIHQFGPIPGEGMAVSAALAPDVQTALTSAVFRATGSPRSRMVVRHLFGSDALSPATPERFGALKTLLARVGSIPRT